MTDPIEDHASVMLGVEAMLRLAGEDERPGLARTPYRFLQAWLELTARPGDPGDLLSITFDGLGDIDEMVAIGPVDFASVCEHHLMPFAGQAWVAYIPDGGRVVGLSKLPRLIEHYARRPQVQERLTGQVTAALDKYLAPLGSACVIRATHTCASLRGVRKQAPMTTSSLTGAFRTRGETRAEFLALTRGGGL
jgi:GTP cyclohydrolase IA